MYDRDAALQVLAYCKKKSIPFMMEEEDKPWTRYEGEFSFTTKRVGKNITREEILNNIHKKYPKDTFEPEISGWFEECMDEEDSANTLYYQTATIKCHPAFYEKFDQYTPKSCFTEYSCNFYVYGSKELLKPIDAMVEKAWKPFNK